MLAVTNRRPVWDDPGRSLGSSARLRLKGQTLTEDPLAGHRWGVLSGSNRPSHPEKTKVVEVFYTCFSVVLVLKGFFFSRSFMLNLQNIHSKRSPDFIDLFIYSHLKLGAEDWLI